MADEQEDARAARPRSGWRWSDDILLFRAKFVAIMAVLAMAALVVYAIVR